MANTMQQLIVLTSILASYLGLVLILLGLFSFVSVEVFLLKKGRTRLAAIISISVLLTLILLALLGPILFPPKIEPF